MGLLRSTALKQTKDGYTPACKGMTINGILLGEPTLISVNPITIGWDHGALPNGIIDEIGNITLDDNNE